VEDDLAATRPLYSGDPSGSVEAAGSFDEVALSHALAEDRLPDASWGETPMIQPPSRSHAEVWPALPYGTWKNTCTTLHLWTQIVGKIRLAQTPWANHSWHVTLYVTPRGLTTSPIPLTGARSRSTSTCRSRAVDLDECRRREAIAARTQAGRRLPRSAHGSAR
jgi:Family of unknown function (DUF5996)